MARVARSKKETTTGTDIQAAWETYDSIHKNQDEWKVHYFYPPGESRREIYREDHRWECPICGGTPDKHVYFNTEQGVATCTNCAYVFQNFAPVQEGEKMDTEEIWQDFVVREIGYKNVSHWREICAQLSGGGGYVPEYVIARVKEKYQTDRQEVNPLNTIKILKDLSEMEDRDYAKYYEHSNQISGELGWNNTNNDQGEFQEKLDAMWTAARNAWANRPPELRGRTSFPVYKNFIRLCCVYHDRLDLAANMKRLITPSTAEKMNKIWSFFGKKEGFRIFLLLLLKRRALQLAQLPEGSGEH